MSKKKPPKKKAAKKPMKKPAKKLSAAVPRLRSAATGRTSQATIFLIDTPNGLRIRTAPQYITAGPGHVEWTVVNLTGKDDIPVEISFPKGGPWGGEKVDFREGWIRKNCDDAAQGVFKYTVTAAGVSEDPEIEIPEN